MRGEDGEAVGGIDVDALADDHVAVAVAVRGGTEVGRVGAHHGLVEVVAVDRVGVGMVAAEVGQRLEIDDAVCGEAELIDKDRLGVGASRRAHRIEAHAQARGEGGADLVEVEQGRHQRLVVGDRVDHLDARVAELVRADRRKIEIWRLERLVAQDVLGARKDRVGDLLRRGATVADVVLDAEVAVGTAGIVRGGQDDAAERFSRADHAGCGRRGEQAALPDQDAAEPIRRRHLDDGLARLLVEEAPVAADDQGLAFEAFERVEDRLHEVLEIARLPEHLDLLAQPGGAGLLPLERLGCDRLRVHLIPLVSWRHEVSRHRRLSIGRPAVLGAAPLLSYDRRMALPLATKMFLESDGAPEDGAAALGALWWAHRGGWERAHALVQDADGQEAAWVHAHLHRLEGDLANASYWYRRAGRSIPTGDPTEERTAMIATLLDKA